MPRAGTSRAHHVRRAVLVALVVATRLATAQVATALGAGGPSLPQGGAAAIALLVDTDTAAARVAPPATPRPRPTRRPASSTSQAAPARPDDDPSEPPPRSDPAPRTAPGRVPDRTATATPAATPPSPGAPAPPPAAPTGDRQDATVPGAAEHATTPPAATTPPDAASPTPSSPARPPGTAPVPNGRATGATTVAPPRATDTVALGRDDATVPASSSRPTGPPARAVVALVVALATALGAVRTVRAALRGT